MRALTLVLTGRSNSMEKLGLDSLVGLVKPSARMGLVDVPTGHNHPASRCDSALD